MAGTPQTPSSRSIHKSPSMMPHTPGSQRSASNMPHQYSYTPGGSRQIVPAPWRPMQLAMQPIPRLSIASVSSNNSASQRYGAPLTGGPRRASNTPRSNGGRMQVAEPRRSSMPNVMAANANNRPNYGMRRSSAVSPPGMHRSAPSSQFSRGMPTTGGHGFSNSRGGRMNYQSGRHFQPNYHRSSGRFNQQFNHHQSPGRFTQMESNTMLPQGNHGNMMARGPNPGRRHSMITGRGPPGGRRHSLLMPHGSARGVAGRNGAQYPHPRPQNGNSRRQSSVT